LKRKKRREGKKREGKKEKLINFVALISFVSLRVLQSVEKGGVGPLASHLRGRKGKSTFSFFPSRSQPARKRTW
jgi:hypothetical protein